MSPARISTSSPFMSSTLSPKDYAITLTAQRDFHQWTTYPSPDEPGKLLKVSFATTTNFNDEGADRMPTILVLGPMMCSRYYLISYNHIACKEGVRLIHVDRPGFGLTAPVPSPSRIPHVLASLTSILTHLAPTAVALLSTSAGILYLLPFLSSPVLRSYLHPRHPYAASLVPWVDPHLSGTGMLSTAAVMPTVAIGAFATVQKFVIMNFGPGSRWVGDVVEGLERVSGSGMGLVCARDRQEEADDDDGEEREVVEAYGVGRKGRDELMRCLVSGLFAEGSSGIRDEALFLLQKNLPSTAWGVCASYPDFVSSFAAAEKQRRLEHPEQQRLRFRAYFAETDMMIGTGGREYFGRCWRDCKDVEKDIDYDDTDVPDTNHETIMTVPKGVIGRILNEVKEGWEDGLP